jgi:hypothetical protein
MKLGFGNCARPLRRARPAWLAILALTALAASLAAAPGPAHAAPGDFIQVKKGLSRAADAWFSVTVSPDGSHFYVTGSPDNALVVFEAYPVPTLASVSIDSDSASSSGLVETANPGDTVSLVFAADEAIQAPTVTFTVGGAAAAGDVSVDPVSFFTNIWVAQVTLEAGEAAGAVGFRIDFMSEGGSLGFPVEATSDGSSVSFDPNDAASTPTTYIVTSFAGSWPSVPAYPGDTSIFAPAGLSTIDDAESTLDISHFMTFEYFDTPYTAVVIGSNGYITFSQETGSAHDNASVFPDVSEPHGFIAPFWDDLVLFGPDRPGLPDRVYVVESGSGTSKILKIIFESVSVYSDGWGNHYLNFQVWLYANDHSSKPNVIEFYYGNRSTSGLASATIGIEGGIGIGNVTAFYEPFSTYDSAGYVTSNRYLHEPPHNSGGEPISVRFEPGSPDAVAVPGLAPVSLGLLGVLVGLAGALRLG